MGVQLRVENLRNNILLSTERNLNYRFMVAEWLWILFGMNELKVIEQYNSEIRKFSDDGLILSGAYGPRLHHQWEYVVNKLKEDPNTRQAVASIWTPVPHPSKDIPCTLTMQFLIRDEKLHCIVNMRSSDIWLGLPYDVFTFSMLTNFVGISFSHLELGSLTMNLGSSHLYERDLPKSMSTAVQLKDIQSPRLIGFPGPKVYKILKSGQYELSSYNTHIWDTYCRVLTGKRSEALGILEVLHEGTNRRILPENS